MITTPSNATWFPEVLSVTVDQQDDKKPIRSGKECSCGILSVYVKGGPAYRLGDVTYEFVPPVALLIPAGTLDVDLQEGDVWGMFLLFKYPPEAFVKHSQPGRSVLTIDGKRIVAPTLKSLSRRDAARMLEFLRKVKSLNLAYPVEQMLAAGLLLQAIAEYVKARGQTGGGPIHREAERLKLLIERFAFDGVSLSDIYDKLTLSPSHSEALFNKAYGMSPNAYRINLRMNRARQLLATTKMNVGEVSRQVGIDDPLYFSRIFKKRFGSPPSTLITDFRSTRKITIH